MLYLHAVNGGLRYCGMGTANGTALAAALPSWTAYVTGGSWKNFVLARPGQVLYLIDTDPSSSVFGGARTKRLFRDLEKTFDVSWDYSDLDG